MSNRIALEDGTELTAEAFGQLLVEQLSDRLGASLNGVLASEREQIATKAAVELRLNSPLMNDLNETIASKFSEFYTAANSPGSYESRTSSAIIESITTKVIHALVIGTPSGPSGNVEYYRRNFRAALLNILECSDEGFPENNRARNVLLEELANRMTTGANADTVARSIANMVGRQTDFVSKIAAELSNEDFADAVAQRVDRTLHKIVAEQVNKVLDSYQSAAFKMDNLNDIYTAACDKAQSATSGVRELHQVVRRLEERIELLQEELKLREVPKMQGLRDINPFTGEEFQLAAEPRATEEVPF
jgi:hypothetical protein